MISMNSTNDPGHPCVRTIGAIRVRRLHVDEMNAEPVYPRAILRKAFTRASNRRRSYLARNRRSTPGPSRANALRPVRRPSPLRPASMLSLRFKSRNASWEIQLEWRHRFGAGGNTKPAGAARASLGRSGSAAPAREAAAAFSTVRRIGMVSASCYCGIASRKT